ncbi:head GIN domain-containing protein [uncultured Polaribacter sp.]|uniref:head GIN domain-containing protein n=1 Tax=uncultured Polaribacter sp. TaxID=174711 RepID=UPI002617D4DE|nr:head GIN domain-containing protein [uncultured Polaribacter sp.]
MKNIFFIGILFITLLSSAQNIVNKNLGDFSILKVYNGIELELIKANQQKIEITGAKSEMVKIKNVDGTLKLSLPFSLTPENNVAEGKILIKLYYSKSINVIDANEGATITGKNFNQDKVAVNAQERAFINLTTESKFLTVRASSGGIVKLSGTTKNQDVDVDLYGIYHGYNLKTVNSLTVKSGTGAKAEVFAGETLNAKVNFGGTIFYKGNPEVIKDKRVIGGIIKKKD